MNQRRLGTAVAAAALVVSGLVAGCAGRSHATPTGSGTYQLIEVSDTGIGAIHDLITHAHNTIRLAIYQLADRTVTEELIDAHRRRGVKVRVLLDSAWHGHQVNTAAYRQLRDGGVDVTWTPESAIWHLKSLSTDGSTVAIGSANLVSKDYGHSRDIWIIDHDREDVAAVDATFDADTAAAGPPTPGVAAAHLIWSPHARRTFLQAIADARHSIAITTEVFTDRPLARAIAAAARRGVRCRMLLPADPASDAAVGILTEAGCTVHTLKDTAPLYMHQKLALIDDIAIAGSHNLTPTSLNSNREVSVRLDRRTAPAIIDALAATFDADAQNGQ